MWQWWRLPSSLKPTRHHPPTHSSHWQNPPQQPQKRTDVCRLPCPPTHPQDKSLALRRAGRTTVKRTEIQMATHRQLVLASAFITSHFCDTQKLVMKRLLCAHDGLRGAITPAFGAHSIHGWDSQRSVMNIHVWSAAGMILREIERGRKMNIELTCWAG